MKLNLLQFLSFFFLTTVVFSQEETFDRQDTLRGSITKERAWWDLTHYDLSIVVKPDTKTITGINTVG